MKNLFKIASLLLIISACSNSHEGQTKEFGGFGDTSFMVSDAIAASEVLNALNGQDSMRMVVTGDVSAACQAKGCWLTMDAGQDEMLVKFKDYGFFVPKNSAGHKATISGLAKVSTISVAELQEIAKDEEKSEEEIAQISEPEVKLSFIADGVIIR